LPLAKRLKTCFSRGLHAEWIGQSRHGSLSREED
jgi:hypothetical protein